MKHKMYLRAGLAACAAAFLLTAADAGETYLERLNAALFRAAEKADVTKARAILKDYREHRGTSLSQEYIDTVKACYKAGAPELTVRERRNILAHDNIKEFYAPNDNMRFAEGFANGWGVDRDMDRAIAFACHANDVPRELINQVQALKRGKFAVQAPFLFCTSAVSNDNIGKCAAFAEKRTEFRRKAKFMILTWDFDAAEKAAFKKLRAAADAYFDATAKYEIGDDIDRPRKLAYYQILDAKRDHFIALLDTVVHNRFPPPKDGGYHADKMDRTLNVVYREIIGTRAWKDPLDHPGAVSREGLKRSERAWVAYKEAWLNFLRLRIPDDTPETEMSAYLTEDRLYVLKKMYNGE